MIVRCPECQTGFNLPPDKIGDKGTKVRCSKCDHVFRVKLGFDGRPEVFYHANAAGDPPTRELDEDLFHETHSKTQLSRPVNIGGSTIPQYEAAGNSTSIGAAGRASIPTPVSNGNIQKPRVEAKALRRTEVSQTDFNPFPHQDKAKAIPKRPQILTPTPRMEMPSFSASPPPPSPKIQSPPVGLTPPPIASGNDSGFGIDLFGDDDSGFGKREADDDPFAGAFQSLEDNDFFSPISTGALSLSESQSGSEPIQIESPWQGNVPDSEPDPVPVQTSDDFFFQQRETEFGPADDLVDADFGVGVPTFDANEQIIKAPADPKPAPQKVERRVNAVDPRALAKTRQSTRGKERVEAPPDAKPIGSSVSIQKPSIEPHKIGGSTARRLFDTMVIGLIVLNGFVLVVAGLSGWFFDFQDPLHMLEVAFEGKPYKPRAEWTAAIPDEKPIPIAQLETSNPSAEVGRLGKKYVLVVRGTLKNPNESSQPTPTIEIELEQDGKSQEVDAIVGSEIDLETYDPEVERKTPESLEPGMSVPFFALFELNRAPKEYRFSAKLK